jgi:hypothetical protein
LRKLVYDHILNKESTILLWGFSVTGVPPECLKVYGHLIKEMLKEGTLTYK